MDPFAVLQRHNSQVPPKLLHVGPVAHASVRLHLPPQRLTERSLAPLAPDVRALSEHLLLEVARGLLTIRGSLISPIRLRATRASLCSGHVTLARRLSRVSQDGFDVFHFERRVVRKDLIVA